MEKEGRQPSRKDLRQAEIEAYIDGICRERLILSRHPLKPVTEVLEPYKKVVIDVATSMSMLSDEQVREEARRMDEKSTDKASLIERSKRDEELNYYYKIQVNELSEEKSKEVDAENKIIVKGLLRQAVTARKVRLAVEGFDSYNKQEHQMQSDIATNLSIRAVLKFSNK
jgi:hypothetical protein